MTDTPALHATQWFSTDRPLTLSDFRGKVVAVEAFLHGYRIRFPVAVDAPGDGALPRTMTAWGLQGTPTLVLFDRAGRMRARRFGQISGLALGARIMQLVLEAPAP